VRNHPGSRQTLGRYLTPFYNITLGLVFILALTACDHKPIITPNSATATQVAVLTTSPKQFGTQAITKNTITPLPDIPATPNVLTPSPLGVTSGDLSGLEVDVWHPWTGATEASFEAILDEFNRTNKWGITVKATGHEGYGSLDDAMETAVTTETLPDVLVDYGYQARHWDESGVLVDLTPYVEDTVWGLTSEEQADFFPGFWAEDLVTSGVGTNFRRIGIPYYRSAYVLFYNQSWAKELGYLEPPATPDEFRVQACAAAESVARLGDKSALGKGGWLITPEPGGLLGWIYAFGGHLTNPEASGYLFDTPETRQTFAFLKGLQVSGCAWTDTGLATQSEFANRQALFVVGSLLDIPSQQTAFAQVSSADVWEVIPFPSSHQPAMDTYGPSLLVMHSTPAKQLAAWLVVEWLVYPPNQATFVGKLEAYPTRQTTLSYLGNEGEATPQWVQALKLLPDAQGEPTLPSWNVMRWALNDASDQLFRVQFNADQIPSLISNLGSLAQEIVSQVH